MTPDGRTRRWIEGVATTSDQERESTPPPSAVHGSQSGLSHPLGLQLRVGQAVLRVIGRSPDGLEEQLVELG